MRIMLGAALAALSIGSIGPAFAGEGEGGPAYSPQQALIAQAPAQTPSVASAQNGPVTHVYVTQSSHGAWLFAPAQNGNN